MAGDWIPFDHELPDTAQVLSIFEATGVEPATILGRLFFLWRHFDRQTEDGTLPIGLRAISQIAGGDPDFWQAVVDVEWLTLHPRNGDRPATAEIPDFEKRFGRSARRRLLDARRAKERRAVDKSPTPDRRDDDDPGTQQSISESPSQPQAKLQPEERIDHLVSCFKEKPDLAAEVLALARRKFTPPRGPWSRSFIRENEDLRVLLLKLATLLKLGMIGEQWVDQTLEALRQRSGGSPAIDKLPGWLVTVIDETAQKRDGRTIKPLLAAVKLPRDLLGAAAGDGPKQSQNPRSP